MNVAMVSTLHHGGPVEHALVLAGGLVDAGIDVRVVCASQALADRFTETGAEAVPVELRSPWDLPGALAMQRATRGTDLVHAQDRRASLWTRLLPRSRRTALVSTVHGLPDAYLPPPAGPAAPGLRAVAAYRGLDVALIRRADAVVTPSQAVLDVLVARLGYPRAALTVVPNGVVVPPSMSTGSAVGTLSVLEPVKGLDVFLDAAAVLAADHPELELTLFGSGGQEAELKRHVSRLGLDERVRFAGHVRTATALASLQVLALPSLMENCPMAMLEAMAAGVPVVASRVGGIPEMAPAGTATLVPPRDARALAAAIATLVDDPVRRAAQADRARAHVEREASQAVMTRRMLEVYDRAQAARAR